MSKKKALITLLIKYSLTACIFFLMVCFLIILLDKNPLVINSMVPFSLILLPIIFFGINYEIKNYIYGGYVKLFRLFFSNLSVLIVFVLLSSFILFIFIKNKPTLFDDYKTKSIMVLDQALKTDIEQLGESKDVIVKKKDALMTVGIYNWLGSDAIKNTFIGGILSFIISIFFSRKKVKRNE